MNNTTGADNLTAANCPYTVTTWDQLSNLLSSNASAVDLSTNANNFVAECPQVCNAIATSADPDLTGIGLIAHYCIQVFFTFIFSGLLYILFPLIKHRASRWLPEIRTAHRLFADFNVYATVTIVVAGAVRLTQTPSAYEQQAVELLIPLETLLATCSILSLLMLEPGAKREIKTFFYLGILFIINLTNTLSTYLPVFYSGNKYNFYSTVNTIASQCNYTIWTDKAEVITGGVFGWGSSESAPPPLYYDFALWTNVWAGWLCFFWAVFAKTVPGMAVTRYIVRKTGTAKPLKGTTYFMDHGGWYISVTGTALVLVAPWFITADPLALWSTAGDVVPAPPYISMGFWIAIGVPIVAFIYHCIMPSVRRGSKQHPLPRNLERWLRRKDIKMPSNIPYRYRQRWAALLAQCSSHARRLKFPRHLHRLIWLPQIIFIYVVGPVWAIVTLLQYRHAEEELATNDNDNDWGVGQIGALLAWLPFLVEASLRIYRINSSHHRKDGHQNVHREQAKVADEDDDVEDEDDDEIENEDEEAVLRHSKPQIVRAASHEDDIESLSGKGPIHGSTTSYLQLSPEIGEDFHLNDIIRPDRVTLADSRFMHSTCYDPH